jgi:polyhydroxybutyrate depolymerase
MKHIMGRVWRWAGMVALAMCATSAGAAATPETRQWLIDGVTREALFFRPSATNREGAPPVIFAFHGHGGTMAHAARVFALQAQWPEALVIYPQGLKTAGLLTDPEGKRAGR